MNDIFDMEVGDYFYPNFTRAGLHGLPHIPPLKIAKIEWKFEGGDWEELDLPIRPSRPSNHRDYFIAGNIDWRVHISCLHPRFYTSNEIHSFFKAGIDEFIDVIGLTVSFKKPNINVPKLLENWVQHDRCL